MANSKKKKSSKKPVAKVKKAAPKPPAKASTAKARQLAVKAKVRAKAKPTASAKAKPTATAKAKPTATAKAKPTATTPAVKKAAPRTAAKPKPATNAKAPKPPTEGEAWGNASLKKQADAATPMARMTEPSGTPPLALHDHEGELVTPVEREADGGSPRLDDREDDEA